MLATNYCFVIYVSNYNKLQFFNNSSIEMEKIQLREVLEIVFSKVIVPKLDFIKGEAMPWSKSRV